MAAPPRTDWFLVVLLWLAGLGAAGQYAKISVIFDRLPEVYPQAGAALGFIVSLVGAVGIALGVAAGVMVARIGPRRAILWGLWGGAVLTLTQAVFPPLPLFLALRVLEGAAHLALVVAIPTMIAALSSETGRGLALTLWSTFFSVAFSLLTWVGLPLVERFGLSAIMLLHGGWMVLFAVILMPLLPRGLTDRAPFSARAVLAAHWRIYRSPRIAAPAYGWLCYTIVFLATLTLIPPFLPEDGRVLLLGALPITAIVVSLTLGVWALSWAGAVGVVIGGFLACVGFCAALMVFPGNSVLVLGLFGGLGLVQGASFAAVPVLNASVEDRALANGGLAQAGNLGNTIGTPLFVWIIAIAGYPGMMAASVLVLGLGAAVHLALAARRQRLALKGTP